MKGSVVKTFLKALVLMVLVHVFFAGIVYSQESKSKPNVVLIVIDTLRADHLPFYGYERNTAPFLDSLAKKGWVFANNFSTSSWTAPASASVITSLYPFQHGVIMGRSATRRLQKAKPGTKLNKIPDSVETIAETFKKAGYSTFGVVDNGNLRPDAGFAQGFDEYQVFQNEGGENLSKTVNGWSQNMLSSKPYFLYMQFMDPHHPYRQRSPWFGEYFDGDEPSGKGNKEKKAVAKMLASYDSEISFVDAAIERLHKKLAWNDNTIMMLTSDHGEEFFEHKKLGHGKSLYSEVVRVPLMAYDSRMQLKKGSVIEENTTILDIVPTLLELAGVDAKSNHYEGRSLVALAGGQSGDLRARALYTHLWKRVPSGEEIEMYSTILGDSRFIYSSKPKVRALFDIRNDPGEQKNLKKELPEKLKSLEENYFAFLGDAKKFPKEWADTDLLAERDDHGDE